MSKFFEERLEQLRREALDGPVGGSGTHARGGPQPGATTGGLRQNAPGYYGLPLLKPPVWEWMISAYFFVGGLSGMAGLLAFGGVIQNKLAFSRVALWLAAVGILVSTVLLIWDLGRPLRFINMLRVFKYRSPMSVGSWIVSGFGACSIPAALATEWRWHLLQRGVNWPVLNALAIALITIAAVFGVFLATYTGALIAVTAIPAWFSHRLVLPFHFGIAGLGSAAGALELCGFIDPQLAIIGWFAAAAETLVFLRMELWKKGAVDRALHEGKSGWTLRAGESLEGPIALLLRASGLRIASASAFLLGSLVTRFGWVAAGRASACDPESVFAAQGMTAPLPSAPTPPAARR